MDLPNKPADTKAREPLEQAIATLEKMLESNKDTVNDQFMEASIGLVAQVDQATEQGNPEAQALSEKLSKVYKTAMKFSMKKNMG